MSAIAASRVLGKGLGSLLPVPTLASTSGEGHPLYVPIADVVPAMHQPRTIFADDALTSLAHSIREQGILQPLVVSRESSGLYRLIAGERRLRAARLAGLHEVPIVLRQVTGTEAFELALIENIQREDLNPLEEADAYRRLVEEHGYTQEAIARRVGKDRATVSNALRLLKLRDGLKERVLSGALSAGHARALLGTDDELFQESLARRVEAEGLSVRVIEKLVAGHKDARASARTRVKAAPEVKALSRSLSHTLGRPVKVAPKGDGGAIVIRYTTRADLDALIARLGS